MDKEHINIRINISNTAKESFSEKKIIRRKKRSIALQVAF